MSLVHGSVVVGVDGSDASAAALEWAARLASRESRSLNVVHACGFPVAEGRFEDIIASERGLKSIGRRLVRDAVHEARQVAPELAVTTLVVPGHASTVLVEATETAAVVVLGTRGRGAISSALLGSVSREVTRDAHCPVVVVRAHQDDDHGPVVVGVDGTQASSAAVEFAFHQASVYGAPLTVLHAHRDLRERASSVLDLRSYEQQADLSEDLERVVAEAVAGQCEKYPEVVVTEVYRRGDPVRQLVEASHDASLVVVGSRNRRAAGTLLGSVSRAVAERAACPVAVALP